MFMGGDKLHKLVTNKSTATLEIYKMHHTMTFYKTVVHRMPTVLLTLNNQIYLTMITFLSGKITDIFTNH